MVFFIGLNFLFSSFFSSFSGESWYFSDCFFLDSLKFWSAIFSLLTISLGYSFYPQMQFHFFLLSFLFGFWFSGKLMVSYIFFELSVLPLLLLLSMKSISPERLSASGYFSIYTLIGSIPFIFSILFFSQSHGDSLFFSNYWYFMLESIQEHTYYKLEILLFFLPFLMKTPLFLLHLWLLRAHVESSTMGSVFLAAILLKTGIVGIFRLKMFYFEVFFIRWLHFFLLTLMVSSLVVNFMVFRSSDLKLFIAYSSISHSATALLALVFLGFPHFMGSLCFSLGHGFISAKLFFSSSSIYEHSNSRKILLNCSFLGVFPLLVFLFFSSLVGKASMPPFMTFYGEFLVYSGFLSYTKVMMMVLVGIILLMSGSFNSFLFLQIGHGQSVKFKGSHFLKLNFLHKGLLLMNLFWALCFFLIF